jgi:hypothetical protein
MDTRFPLRELIREDKKRKAAERFGSLLIEGLRGDERELVCPLSPARAGQLSEWSSVGAQAACDASVSGHIAVIGTRVRCAGAYQEAILCRRTDARISALATPLFAGLAEEGVCPGPSALHVGRH